jgi:hypothetical protein
VLALLLGATSIDAQTTPQIDITSYVIRTQDGSIVAGSPLRADGVYMVDFEITIAVGLEDITLTLETPMEDVVGSPYWNLENDYPGIDTRTWQQGQPSIDFQAVEGVAQFRLMGRVPSDYTLDFLSSQEWDADEVLHFPRDIYPVKLLIDTRDLLDRSVEVTDQLIDTYRQTLSEKQNLLDNTDVASEYDILASEILFQAETLSDRGYLQRAKNLLDTLPDSQSGFPAPSSDESSLPLIVVIAVVAVILLIFFFLFLRARSASGLIRQQVEDEAGRLDVLLVRVSKLDKQLAGDIEQVKEQLERLSGR